MTNIVAVGFNPRKIEPTRIAKNASRHDQYRSRGFQPTENTTNPRSSKNASRHDQYRSRGFQPTENMNQPEINKMPVGMTDIVTVGFNPRNP